MTFAELFLSVLFFSAVYWLLTPLRRRIEKLLYGLLRSNGDPPSPVIDITDYTKKDDDK